MRKLRYRIIPITLMWTVAVALAVCVLRIGIAVWAVAVWAAAVWAVAVCAIAV